MGSKAKIPGFCRLVCYLFLIPVFVAIGYPLWLFYLKGHPIKYILPNILLFTPYRELTQSLWHQYVKIDTKITYGTAHIPIIEVEDFTYERLKEATNDFRNPALVKRMFLDSKGVKLWSTPDYLPSVIGNYRIPVVNTAAYASKQNDRMFHNNTMMTFGDAFHHIFHDPHTKMYLFFPVFHNFNLTAEELAGMYALQKELNKLTLEDLELDRIWPGFGTKSHKTYFGSQFVIGKGQTDIKDTTGTGWHCAAGNNWFVQVVGRKRWYFMDPKDTPYMFPLRGSKVNMMTGNVNMLELHDHLKLSHADLDTGDMLYNPDWYWHTIKNYEGLSIGVPIREANVSMSFRNNFQFTTLLILNKLMDKWLGFGTGALP